MDDTILEKDETFTVQFSNDPQYTTLADGTAVGTTVDDEENMEVSVSRGYDLVNENHSRAVWFTVTLSHSTTTNHERAPAVAWRTVAGTATEGEDYRAGSGPVHLSRGRPRGSSTYTSPTTTGTRRPWRPSVWNLWRRTAGPSPSLLYRIFLRGIHPGQRNPDGRHRRQLEARGRGT